MWCFHHTCEFVCALQGCWKCYMSCRTLRSCSCPSSTVASPARLQDCYTLMLKKCQMINCITQFSKFLYKVPNAYEMCFPSWRCPYWWPRQPRSRWCKWWCGWRSRVARSASTFRRSQTARELVCFKHALNICTFEYVLDKVCKQKGPIFKY